MKPGTRIEICGGIATGKTTLARLIAQTPGSALVLEDFRANPFWQRFYADPVRFAAEKNICFIAQHSGEIKPALASTLTVCDYAVVQDLAYAKLNDDITHLQVMTAIYAHLYAALPPPSLLVHLKAEPAVQLARIRARGRAEEAPIGVSYLAALNSALDAVLRLHPPACQVLVIRSDTIDFAHDDDAARGLQQALLASLAASPD